MTAIAKTTTPEAMCSEHYILSNIHVCVPERIQEVPFLRDRTARQYDRLLSS